jgi:hypothetical protein
MTPFEILLTAGVIATLVLFHLFLYSIRQERARVATRDHISSQLAIQRIAYIRDLRFALREAEKYIKIQTNLATGSMDTESLLVMIHKLTTSADNNGQPLKKGNNELY